MQTPCGPQMPVTDSPMTWLSLNPAQLRRKIQDTAKHKENRHNLSVPRLFPAAQDMSQDMS